MCTLGAMRMSERIRRLETRMAESPWMVLAVVLLPLRERFPARRSFAVTVPKVLRVPEVAVASSTLRFPLMVRSPPLAMA